MDERTTSQASTLMVSGIMFGISAIVTLAFGYALIADQSLMTNAWTWVRELPLVVQLGLWLLFLPWMIALWVWTLPLALGVRVLVVVAILAIAEYLLFPWKGAKS